jgi:hypothetical protein
VARAHGINPLDCSGWYGSVTGNGFEKAITLLPVAFGDGSSGWEGIDEQGTATHDYYNGIIIREEGTVVRAYNTDDYIWVEALSSGYMVSYFMGAGCTNGWNDTVLLNENAGCFNMRYSATGGSVQLTFYDYESALASGLLPVRNFNDLAVCEVSNLYKMKLFCIGWLLLPKTFDPND